MTSVVGHSVVSLNEIVNLPWTQGGLDSDLAYEKLAGTLCHCRIEMERPD